jgi:hypothetical protein
VFDLPNHQSSTSNPTQVAARMIRIDGVMKLVVDLSSSTFTNVEPLFNAVKGQAKCTFGRFRNISDVVRLFEEEGLDEANNLDQPARQKKSNARLMYDEWLRMGGDQKSWDDKFSTGGKIWSKTFH